MFCYILSIMRCQFGLEMKALACLVFPRLDLVGWCSRVTRWCSLAIRTLDRVLIAGVSAGKFIFAVRCERLLRRLRHRAVGMSLILFVVCLSAWRDDVCLVSLVFTLGTCRDSTLGT
jgi:hypothetical protein